MQCTHCAGLSGDTSSGKGMYFMMGLTNSSESGFFSPEAEKLGFEILVNVTL